MNSELTFNIDKIIRSNIEWLSNQKTRSAEVHWIRTVDCHNYTESIFKVSSDDLRTFIQDTFGIIFSIDVDGFSHRRNQLNKLIKKVAVTQRAKKTILTFGEYKRLIMLKDFETFIIRNMKQNKVKDIEKLARELTYLQMNRYHESADYIKIERLKRQSIAYCFNLLPFTDQDIKVIYEYQILKEQGIPVPDEYKNIPDELLDIVEYRNKQQLGTVYKFDSLSDVDSTNPVQIIKFFLEDIERWDNDITEK